MVCSKSSYLSPPYRWLCHSDCKTVITESGVRMASDDSLTSLDESTVETIEQDPLMIQQLSLSYDYLIYKIKEQIEGIAEMTKLSIVDTIEESNRQLLDIDGSIERLKRLLDESNNIEQEIVTIQQIGMIVHDFNQRLDDLETYYSNR